MEVCPSGHVGREGAVPWATKQGGAPSVPGPCCSHVYTACKACTGLRPLQTQHMLALPNHLLGSCLPATQQPVQGHSWDLCPWYLGQFCDTTISTSSLCFFWAFAVLPPQAVVGGHGGSQGEAADGCLLAPDVAALDQLHEAPAEPLPETHVTSISSQSWHL